MNTDDPNLTDQSTEGKITATTGSARHRIISPIGANTTPTTRLGINVSNMYIAIAIAKVSNRDVHATRLYQAPTTAGGELRIRVARPTGSIKGFLGLLAGKTKKVATIEEMNEAAAAGWAGDEDHC